MHCLWKYEVIGKGSYIYNNVVVLHTIVFSLQTISAYTVSTLCFKCEQNFVSYSCLFQNKVFLHTITAVPFNTIPAYQDTISIIRPLSRANILYLGLESREN